MDRARFAAPYLAAICSALGCSFVEFPEPAHRPVASQGTGGASARDGATGAGCDGSMPFPSTPVLDSFDRADGAPGSNWVGSGAGFSVRNGALAGDDVGGTSLYFAERFGADQEVYATLTDFDPALYDMSLIFKSQSTTEGCPSLRVRYANDYTTPNSVLVTQCENSTFSILLDDNVPSFHPGGRIGARVFSNGCVEAFADDANPDGGAPPKFVFVGAADASAFPAVGFPGYVGVYSQVLKERGGGVPCVWDDFGGGDVR